MEVNKAQVVVPVSKQPKQSGLPGTKAEVRHRTGVRGYPKMSSTRGNLEDFPASVIPWPPPRHERYPLLKTMPDAHPIAASVLQPVRNVVSASFLYPFKGVYYFLTHREFYPLFSRHLIPLTAISIVILGLLFTFTYVPQAVLLLVFHGPTAWFNAVFLVLGEGQVLIALLFEAFMVDETLVNVFDVCLGSRLP
jgi:hypothetical protein